MKKKILSFVVVLAMLCAFMPTIANAEKSGVCGYNVNWTLDDNGMLTISGKGPMSNLSTDDSPFYRNRSNIKSIMIENGVTTIMDYAFEDCSNLIDITIPDSVTWIGEEAFYGCRSLADVYYNGAFTDIIKMHIGSFNGEFTIAKLHCNDVEANKWGYFNRAVGWVLDDNEKLIIKGAGDMANYSESSSALYDIKSNIKSVVIENGVTSIGSYVFEDCDELTSISIPSSIIKIGNMAFDRCYKLESVYISDFAAYLNIKFCDSASNPMRYAKKLYLNNKRVSGTVTIPDSVTQIPIFAFDGIDSITSVIISNSVTSINTSAFGDCSSLVSITIPNNVINISNYAFIGCSSLTDVYYKGKFSDFAQISIEADNSCLLSAKLHCSDVETAKWGKCGKNVGWTLADGTLIISGRGNMGDYNTYSYYSPFYRENNIKSIIIEDGVTSIGKNMFYCCNGLKYVIIPESMVSINDYAFYGCDKLTSITIPDSLTSIGNYAFSGCERLENIMIGSGLKDIGIYAFKDCDGIINISYNVPKVFSNVFNGCNVSSVFLGNNVVSIEKNAFNNCSNLNKIHISKNVTEIEKGAFAGCANLTTVEYSGNQSDWNEIYIGTDNENLTNATINYNNNAPTPKPTPIPITKATIIKTETDTTYDFDVAMENTYEDCYVYAAVYDENGILCAINRVPLETTGNTSVSVDKNDNAKKAKVFVFSSTLQPIITSEEFPLI
ncbi:leucine-rich repeat protein [Eubacterium ventriosum]|uniref:leucine-rich repeat protein n=1 Tax=Eubacterium ventriosum TaxID=39496 RepID=UPI003AB4B8CF